MKKYNSTEESVFTLFALYIQINQAFESLTNDEDILDSDFDISKSTFNDLVNNTIQEALVYQILLKTCGFIDEWDKVFGVHTEEQDKTVIRRIKLIVKSARSCILQWKDLKDFRNEVIAHNHRNKQSQNIFLTPSFYNSPDSISEIYLLVFCLKRMTDTVYFFFKDVINRFVKEKNTLSNVNTGERLSSEQIKKEIEKIDIEIGEALMKVEFENPNI